MIREKTIFRNLLFGAVLLAGTALVVSCSVDEATGISDMNAISFRTEFTRATATTINTLDEFTVWGWETDGDGAVIGTLMNGDTAANLGNGTYETTKTYYWPGCSVDFLAVSPVVATANDTEGTVYIGEQVSMTEIAEDGTSEVYTGYFAEGTVDTTSGRIETLTVHVPEYAADQADLLYAYTPEQSSGKVPMNFRHALAQVEFKALNTNSLMTVEVDGVKVASVANHGELTLPTETTSATDGAYGTWTPAPVYNLTEYSAGLPSEAVTLGSDAIALTADGGSLFLIPQECEAWVHTDATNTAAGAYFLISCRMTELGVELWPGTGTCAEIAIPFAPDWEQGKKYTYTFYFGDGAGYYPPTDVSNPGNSIFGNPIHFIVDVEDFGVETDEEYVEIDDILPYLTDENFQAYVAANFDFDGNGHVSSVEAATVTSIRCGNYPNNAEYNYPDVKDFTGIEYFTGLTSFESNTAVTLDLSKNTELTTLRLGYYRTTSSAGVPEIASPITSLDLSPNTKLTSLDTRAFYECANLKTIILPSTLTSLGDYCFDSCPLLTDVELPEGLTTIGTYAFEYCTLLKIVGNQIPNTVTSVNTGAFEYSGLETIIWSSGAEELPRFAFRSCTSLAYVTLPETVTTIDTNAFTQCTGLVSMTIYATEPPTIVGTPFSNAVKFDLYVPAGNVSVYDDETEGEIEITVVEAYQRSSWASYCNNIYAIED